MILVFCSGYNILLHFKDDVATFFQFFFTSISIHLFLVTIFEN